MEIIEYPKALYRDGDYMAVQDIDAEASARADGWTGWHEDHERMGTDQTHDPHPDAPVVLTKRSRKP